MEDGENHVRVGLALRPVLGPSPHPGLGPLRTRALWPVLLTGMGADEARGFLLRLDHVLRQPGGTFHCHLWLLLWHCHQPLRHLQEDHEQRQPCAQHHQAAPPAAHRKWLRFHVACGILPLKKKKRLPFSASSWAQGHEGLMKPLLGLRGQRQGTACRHMHAFGLWKEAGEPGGNPQTQEENANTTQTWS